MPPSLPHLRVSSLPSRDALPDALFALLYLIAIAALFLPLLPQSAGRVPGWAPLGVSVLCAVLVADGKGTGMGMGMGGRSDGVADGSAGWTDRGSFFVLGGVVAVAAGGLLGFCMMVLLRGRRGGWGWRSAWRGDAARDAERSMVEMDGSEWIGRGEYQYLLAPRDGEDGARGVHLLL